MAGRVPIASREAVVTPPPGWRKAIPIAVKLQVIVNQRGLAPDGAVLDAMGDGIQFDHRPCLAERVYDAEKDDTVPAANDPLFIIALPAPTHRKISGRDNVRMSKTARIQACEARFQEILRRKVPGQKRQPTGSIRSKPFDKRKRSFR